MNQNQHPDSPEGNTSWLWRCCSRHLEYITLHAGIMARNLTVSERTGVAGFLNLNPEIQSRRAKKLRGEKAIVCH